MGFSEAVNVVLKQKYADFSGRARRSEFWYFGLAYTLAIFASAILANIVQSLGVVIFLIVLAGGFVPALAVTVRRLHDTGKPGWLILVGVIPIVNFIGGIVLLVFELMDSAPGENKYGPNPKGITGFLYGAPAADYGSPTGT